LGLLGVVFLGNSVPLIRHGCSGGLGLLGVVFLSSPVVFAGGGFCWVGSVFVPLVPLVPFVALVLPVVGDVSPALVVSLPVADPPAASVALVSAMPVSASVSALPIVVVGALVDGAVDVAGVAALFAAVVSPSAGVVAAVVGVVSALGAERLHAASNMALTTAVPRMERVRRFSEVMVISVVEVGIDRSPVTTGRWMPGQCPELVLPPVRVLDDAPLLPELEEPSDEPLDALADGVVAVPDPLLLPCELLPSELLLPDSWLRVALPMLDSCCDDCTRIWLLTSRTPLQLSARSSARCFIQRCSTVPLSVATPLLTSTVKPRASMSWASVSRSLRSSRMRSSERV
jgi:hypothetical protein